MHTLVQTASFTACLQSRSLPLIQLGCRVSIATVTLFQPALPRNKLQLQTKRRMRRFERPTYVLARHISNCSIARLAGRLLNLVHALAVTAKTCTVRYTVLTITTTIC